LISDTDGNVFGGFTPMKWESNCWWKGNCVKGDDSLRSFLFTLRNPHSVPPRRFALKAEKKQNAISCESGCGPAFGYNGDGIHVSDNCNSFTCIGTNWSDCASANNIAFECFLTGAQKFTVKEIEVFEIAD
jgi:hypothetical protein